MNVKEAAKSAETSVRTLRYYEEIGLIAPGREENGYRDYDEAILNRVRLIRAYRELQFSLEETGYMLNMPRMERDAMLESQIRKLEKKRQIIDNRIALATSLRMVGPERFMDIDFSQVDAQMQQAQDSLNSNPEWKAISERLQKESREKAEETSQDLLRHLADVATVPETDVPDAIEALKAFITQNLYPCTPAILQYYARAFGGDGLLAQTLEDLAGPHTAPVLRQRLEPQNTPN